MVVVCKHALGLLLLTPLRKNMKGLASLEQTQHFSRRSIIETGFSVLKDRLGLVTSLPRSLDGYLSHYVLVLLAYQLGRWVLMPCSLQLYPIFNFVIRVIGALLIGLVLGETEQLDRLERIVIPFRDVFGAFLFFSFGLNIDPLALGGAVGIAIAAALVSIVGNFVAGLIAGKISRLPTRSGVNIGLTIVSRGEFSIVLASLAQSGGLLGIIQPFTAVYVLTLSILGRILTKNSGLVYNFMGWAMNLSRSRLSKQQVSGRAANPGLEEEDSGGGADC
jgi:hypothetical protein